MIVDGALSSWCAITWIDALFVLTGQVVRAFSVAGALRALTAGQWVATVSFKAMAASFVIVVSLAESIASALRELARISALSVDASFCWWTFTVGFAANFVARVLSIAGESRATDTNGSVRLNVAFSVVAANSIRAAAWVDADLIDAGFVVRAFSVCGALRSWQWFLELQALLEW
jgi:hypothetical protein